MRHSSVQIRGEALDYQNYLCSCNNVVADGYADGPGRWIARQEWAPDWLREALAGRRGGERPRALPPPGPGPGNAVSVLVLTPGMPVEVYLRTGERSPLGYLVKPLSDYFTRALREE